MFNMEMDKLSPRPTATPLILLASDMGRAASPLIFEFPLKLLGERSSNSPKF